MSYFSLLLKVYATLQRVDVAVRLHKESVWEPENVYLSLPFTLGAQGQNGTLWVEKAGAVIRPWVDQLPGTLLDFYCIQEGLAFVEDTNFLAISMPDTPLLQTGPLEYGTRLVHTQQAGKSPGPLFAWVMKDYWETNFKATLGGFYEFNYYLEWGTDAVSPQDAIERCHAMNDGFIQFRSKI